MSSTAVHDVLTQQGHLVSWEVEQPIWDGLLEMAASHVSLLGCLLETPHHTNKSELTHGK